MTIQEKVLRKFFKSGYHISKDGKVFNHKNIELSGWMSGNYKQVSFRIDDFNIPKKCPVHKLQAYQKFGDKIFEEGIVVRHLNGNPLDNSWDNILIGSYSDNRFDMEKSLRIELSTNASRKMQDNVRTYEDRCKIYEDLKNGVPYSEIMVKYNISSKGTISFMKNKSIEYKKYLGL